MAGGGWFHSWRKKLRRRWKHQPGWLPWLFSLPQRFLLWGLQALPPYFSLGLVERVGRLMWWMPKRRRTALANLEQALPDLTPKERARIGKRSSGLFARNIAEMLVLGKRHKPEDIPSLIQLEPGARELLLAQREQGAVFVQGHFGAMEGFLGLLGALGLRLLTVVRLPYNYYVARALTRGREGWGVDLTTRDGALRRMRTRLREGGSVILPMDVNARRGGIFVPWFGRLASTEPAAAFLAVRSGRPLIVCWCVRQPGGRSWRGGCELVRPESPPERPEMERLVEVTTRIHAALESAILRHPEQYFWIHDRYRTRPPSEKRDEERDESPTEAPAEAGS